MSSGGGVAVVDGAQLGDVDLSLPDHLAAAPLTGAQVIELAESRVSDRLYGIALPETIRSTALGRVGGGFQGAELDGDQAAEKLREYVAAIADALKDDPIVVSILDGSTIQIYLEDEDDFAMLAENLFTELDAQDTGKIKKSEIRRALDHMGVDMGVPPPSELPLLSDILKKHGAEGEEEVGQAQFAEVLQSVLHEVADTLAEKRIVFTHNAKVVNGSKIRKRRSWRGIMKKIALKQLGSIWRKMVPIWDCRHRTLKKQLHFTMQYFIVLLTIRVFWNGERTKSGKL
ncbi:hypothetical protein EUGRSUZ_H04340 [Eucalyptus grandis]|uniref:Uncharacterized protein n=2 Tax=Eucalyptus grandis TaxID=71139 RepID=A0ACC3JWR0_EUCGR|nr:hypothetical protein EUGRSUZ_H04340 [Eucalyptus grandis]